MKKFFFLISACLFLCNCAVYSKRVIRHGSSGEVTGAAIYRCLYPSYKGGRTAGTTREGIDSFKAEGRNGIAIRTVQYPVLSALTLGIMPVYDIMARLFTNPAASQDCVYESEDSTFFAPVLTSINKTKATSGTEIIIKGQNLDKKPQVFFNDIKAEITAINPDSLSVIVPVAKVNTAGVYIKTAHGKTVSRQFTIVPARSPMLSITGLDFTGEDGGKTMLADSRGYVTFRIANGKGAGNAFRIILKTAMTNKKTAAVKDLNFPETFIIGDIPAGTEKKVTIPFTSGLSLNTGHADMLLSFTEANSFDPEPVNISFNTVALEKPDLLMAELSIDDTLYPDVRRLSVGNGNNIVDPGETIEVNVELFNAGTGITKDTVISFETDSKEIDFKSDVSFRAGNIPSGGKKKVTTAFSISKRYKGSETLPVKMRVSDARGIFNKEIPLNIKINRSYPKIEGVNVQSTYVQPQKPAFESGNDLQNIPAAKNKKPYAVAVVIGVRQYSNPDVPMVNYALNDAQTVKDYLEKAMGYDPQNIIYMPNPTHGDMTRVFGKEGDPRGQLSSYLTKNKSEVFVYYSGHGAPDVNTRKAYLVPADASPAFISMNGYSLDTLYQNLALLPAKKVTVVTDACFSGAFNSGNLLKNASPLAIAPKTGGYEKLNIFSSSKGTEISSWYTDKKHGLFTYFFLKGLQGEADADGNKTITAEELEEYLEENVPALATRLYNRAQNPVFSGRKNDKIAEYAK